LAKRKVRAKDLKKQRWAVIVAAVLAFGMIVSLVGVYLSQANWGGRSVLPDQHSDPQPEDYLAYYQGEVDRLEAYLEEHQAGEAVLLELIENYRYLSIVRQVFFDDQEALEEYGLRMVSLYRTLVELEPEKLQYRLEIVNLYLDKPESRELLNEEIADLQELLREKPKPLVHLSLIGILSAAGEEELRNEEALWLYEYLGEKAAEGMADNEELLSYAVLLGEYFDSSDAAEEILNDILEQEEEESNIYQEALNYLSYLRPADDEEEIQP
jgi:hypothetical protein